MIDQALLFLKDRLNAEFLRPVPGQAPVAQEDAVVFLDGDRTDPISFRLGAITMLMVNMGQESLLRAANPYQRLAPDGTPYQIQPDIRLTLTLLFVARFKQYEQSLGQLSRILRFFQQHPVFEAPGTPTLPAGLSPLVMELATLPITEQNELWSALRATYQPSILYRLRLLIFEDQQATLATPVSGITQDLVHAGSAAS